MTKVQLIAEVAAAMGETKAKTEEFLNTFLWSIKDALTSGVEVTIHGFGKFSVSQRAAREGRNPRDGSPVKIKAKKSVKFKAQKALADAVQG